MTIANPLYEIIDERKTQNGMGVKFKPSAPPANMLYCDSECSYISLEENNIEKEKVDSLRAVRRLTWIFFAIGLLLALVYFSPVPPIEPIDTPHPLHRLPFVGPLAVNSELNKAKALFKDRLHAPESMAVDLRNNFYTGVEGGFIIYVDTRNEIYTKVAILNGKSTLYRANQSDHNVVKEASGSSLSTEDTDSVVINKTEIGYEYCNKDVELYGEEAKYSPESIFLSRCSRPLGLRLSPDETYLYVIDPFSGLFLVDLTTPDKASRSQLAPGHISMPTNRTMRQVTLLIDAKQSHKSLESTGNGVILFADDLAVDWKAGSTGGDMIYFTDCSAKWRLRELTYMITDHDETGRVLQYDTGSQQLQRLETVTPARYQANYLVAAKYDDSDLFDDRVLHFPNGVELMDDRQAILINDLGHARILKHYIRGARKGTTELWSRVPGLPDNIKRGADPNIETYWVACACAIEDAKHFDMTIFTAHHPVLTRIFSKMVSMIGRIVEFLGDKIIKSNIMRDYGFAWRNGWLFPVDPVCRHGIVLQYDRDGKIIRSLQAPNFGSDWKLISEAHEILVPIETVNQTSSTESSSNDTKKNDSVSTTKRYLYLGSVYYSYLGRIEL